MYRGLKEGSAPGFDDTLEGYFVALEVLSGSVVTSGPATVGASDMFGSATVGASDEFGSASVGASDEFIILLKSLTTSPTDW
jgi:hypothetical protein